MNEKLPFDRVVAIGLGGIWCRLAPNLAELSLFTDGAPRSMTLIDGDTVEERNIARQGFARNDVGRKKADIWADRMSRRYPGLSIRAEGVFAVPDNAAALVPDRSIVVMSVDNHSTRLTLSRHLRTLENAVLISGGNELWDGNVQIFARSEGAAMTQALEEVHPEIKEPKDRNPGEMSCLERLDQKGGEQILVTNLMVAAHMAAMFYDILAHWSEWREKEARRIAEVMFDVQKYASLGYVRSK